MRATYIDKQTGERVDRTEWHRVTTFQIGLIDMFEKHAKKGRLVCISGTNSDAAQTSNGEAAPPATSGTDNPDDFPL